MAMGSYAPAAAMVGVQAIYASVVIVLKAAFNNGMSRMVAIVYRHVFASLSLAPAAYAMHRRSKKRLLERKAGVKSFALVSFAALIGVAINQNMYNVGLHLGSSSLSTAMANLIPAITFIMSASIGMEKVDVRSLRGNAKILGTIVCVAGAISMAFFKGDKLMSHSASKDSDWLLACLALLVSCCCWSIWLILQVPLSDMFPEPLVLSFWMCLLGCFESGIIALLLEDNLNAWRFSSRTELFAFIYVGVAGSAISYYLQVWCISRRGPLFSALFNPLCNVITTIFAFPITHEHIYAGSLAGAVAVVVGLYVVLWGKAQELPPHGERRQQGDGSYDAAATGVSIEDGCKVDLEESLLLTPAKTRS